MRRRGTSAHGAAQSSTFGWVGLRRKPGEQRRPRALTAARGPRKLHSPPAPPPARARAPTLATEEAPQLGEDEAHAWPRLPAERPGHSELTQAASAVAEAPAPAPAAPSERAGTRGDGHAAPPRPANGRTARPAPRHSASLRRQRA